MSQDGEPSILEYARFYHLARDHSERPPLSGFHEPEDLHSQLGDPDGVLCIDATAATPPSERLSVSKEVAMLLSSAIAPPHGIHLFDDSTILDTHRRRNLKMELPILRTMHELDVLVFGCRNVPDLAREHLPLEKIDEEQDEGIAWPSSYCRLPQIHNAIAMSEKLMAPRSTLGYLESVMKPYRRAGDIANTYNDLMLCKKVGEKAANIKQHLTFLQKAVMEPVTPPLLPFSPPVMPFVPSSDIGDLALLSDHTTPTKQLACELESSIMAPDAIVTAKVAESDFRDGPADPVTRLDDLGHLYSTSQGVWEPPSSPPVRRVKLDDLKVEGPLTPPLSEQPSHWKTKGVSFKEVLMDIIPCKPPPAERPEDVSSENIDAFFAESIAPIAAKFNRALEQEQLQQADTTQRVTVPIMDFSLPLAPWKAYTGGLDGNIEKAQKLLLMKTKADHFRSHLWPANGKAERDMRWAPFPKELGRIATEEGIPRDKRLIDFLAQPECVDTGTLVWKPDGLRILDEVYESAEEDLGHGVFPEATDVDSLVRKRKMCLQSIENGIPDTTVRDFGTENAREPTSGGQEAIVAQRKTFHGRSHSAERSHTYPVLLGSTVSTLGSLESFMSTRSGELKKPKLINSSYFSVADPQFNALAKLPGKTSSIELSQKPFMPTPEKLSLPSPDIAVPGGSRPFVISSTFSSNKRLFRRLQQLFPTANFIERDFTLHSTSSTSSARSKAPISQNQNDTMGDEADLILSPGTGLICTTMQKIKQRALPNQILQGSVHERVIRSSSRYEKLLIVVSEGRLEGDVTDVGAPNSQDCEALTELIRLCMQLECETQVTYVGGGEEDLAKWVVGVMVVHGPTKPDLKLLQDETLWEIFLRRAGMNAYGAQVVLAELKRPTTETTSVSSTMDLVVEFGLTAFVKMSLEERLGRFQTAFGGRRLLLRISNTLDAHW